MSKASPFPLPQFFHSFKAWGQIKAMEGQLGRPLVVKQSGGTGGGGARLTLEARELLAKYDRLIRGLKEKVDGKFKGIFL